jgi:TRAP-type uncharacterized transport system substrate-binding protein
MLESVGLSVKDVIAVPVMNSMQGTDVLGEGKVDAAITAPGVAQVQKAQAELNGRGGVRFLPVETTPQSLAGMRKHMPARIMMLDPAPHLPGIVGPTPVMAYSMYFVANAKVPDDVIYNLVKMLHESKEDLVKVAPVVGRFDPKGMTEATNAPWHAGAMKFYAEVGQWPPKQD